ncbi:MAG: peptidoglycan editing factor PgeF [Clostridium butyricum]|nr:peptidoglycan editing factor PgeF [Clostridium butyricum]
MNRLQVDFFIKQEDYLILDSDRVKIVLTNAEDNRSFNRSTEEGIKYLNSLNEEFNLNDIVYLKQIHSDKILRYYGKNINSMEGDAIVTDVRNVAIGVFTADCVPVILIDEDNNVIAAIHSGWRGTFESITLKTIEKMKNEFGCSGNNIKAYIGAHIGKCCYEVSEELKEKFIEKKSDIDEKKLFNGRNLNLEACIEDDLIKGGVKRDNMFTLGLCTYCSDKLKLHSYRKSEGSYGRMFSFVFLK